jgi:hypothetical protein
LQIGALPSPGLAPPTGALSSPNGGV